MKEELEGGGKGEGEREGEGEDELVESAVSLSREAFQKVSFVVVVVGGGGDGGGDSGDGGYVGNERKRRRGEGGDGVVKGVGDEVFRSNTPSPQLTHHDHHQLNKTLPWPKHQ